MTTLLSNRYQVIRVLGSGGFGQTFLAEDIQLPSRRVCVIKQLTPITDNPEVYKIVKERFQREAVALESLGRGNHQVPELYAYFNENSQFYLVQEWIDGKNLTEQVHTEGCLSESQVKDILVSILPVLSYVHGKGIIHRDIKPDNIILRSEDKQPVLIDFGAVKETVSTVLNSQGKTTSSIVIGTPGFMPSEQAIGRVNFSSDLYSLGLTAIYLLTGKLPQQLDTDGQTGEIEWHSYATNLSPGFVAAIDHAIHFHPRDRYTTAQEMLAALHSHVSTVVTAKPAPVLPTKTAAPLAHPSSLQTVAVGSPSPSLGQNITEPTVNQNLHHSSTNNSQRGLLLGALIASLLGGVAIAGGVMLQKKAPSSPSITKVDVATESPVSSPSQSPSPIASASASPTIRETQIPIPVPKPSVSSPVASTSPEPEPRKSLPSPVPKATNTAAESIPVPKESPDQAVQNYYATINSRAYDAAWQKLTPQFQQSKAGSYDGSFIPWWKSVSQVTVDQANVISTKGNTAVVDARLTYTMKSGQTSSESSRITLVWDEQSKSWLFADAQ